MIPANPITIAGIELPSDHPLFLAVLGIHVAVALGCVVTGCVAILSKKRAGRHPKFGTIYYWCLLVVFLTATILSVMRWAENYYLFILGTLSFTVASVGRTALRQQWRNWIRVHIVCMGTSYIVLLTAFYIDNSKNLPLWKILPPLVVWLLPSVVGLPLILRTLQSYSAQFKR
jgi:primosomal protein N'